MKNDCNVEQPQLVIPYNRGLLYETLQWRCSKLGISCPSPEQTTAAIHSHISTLWFQEVSKWFKYSA